MRLSPYNSAWFLEGLGFAYLLAKQPKEALLAFEEFLARSRSATHASHAYMGRALAYHALGQEQEARAEVAKALEADAGMSVAEFRRLSLSKDRAGLEAGLAILHRLGLPE